MNEKRQTLTLNKPCKAEPAPVPAEQPKTRKERDREAVDRVFQTMRQYRVITKCLPLKIGINADVVALPELRGIPKQAIGAFLRIHCNSKPYKQNLARIGWRYDLAGKVVCPVADEHKKTETETR